MKELFPQLTQAAKNKRITLNKGAIPQEIESFEKVTGLTLPDDIRELYLFTNGFETEDDYLFRIIPLQEISEEITKYPGHYKENQFPFAEYLIYADVWLIEVSGKGYQIVNYPLHGKLNLGGSIKELLQKYLEGGVESLAEWHDEVMAATNPWITERTEETRLIGKHMKMSLAQNRTPELWRSFMTERHKIARHNDLYSVNLYDKNYFEDFGPNKQFGKWAAAEVFGDEEIPEGMESLTIPAGLYAVFIHKGPASEGKRTFRYIFREWLPNSGYKLDHRPHFEVLGPKYKNDSPDSEEQIWIPVKSKNFF